MYRFGRFIVKFKIPILIIALLLLIPSVYGMAHTRINYDMLSYLPEDMETVQGSNILQDQFGKGAFSFIVVEGMSDKDVAALETQVKQVDHVDTVLWYDDILSLDVPKDMLPSKYYDAFNNGDATMMAVFFDSSTSADVTINAISEIRSIVGTQAYVSGMSALVTDLKSMCESQEAAYVGVAVLGAVIALLLLTDSWLVPFIFLSSIGIAIVWNMGSNFLLGEISFLTKTLAAVLQLAVTMDYSIFLWHGFTEKRRKYPGDNNTAMAEAIGDTLVAIFSSALTASAGFLALCFMSYTLGFDLGIVMAKGCLLGLLGSVTTLPALILLFEKALEKTRHKTLIPRADRLARFVTHRYPVLLVIFAIVLVPTVIGYNNKPISYDFSSAFASSTGDNDVTGTGTGFLIANQKLQDDFDVATTEMVLCDANLPHAQAKEMLDRIEDVDGVKYAIGYDSVAGGMLPDSVVPDDVKSTLKSGDYQLILINSSYNVSTDAVNSQIDQINSIVKDYDSSGMLIGEAPATKDLITTTDTDFHKVDWIAIIAIVIILLLVFKSVTLPVILVIVIEFAVMINLGLPYYMGDTMLFIVPVCISTIQLGSTINYAILMTTRYRKERFEGQAKNDAITVALSTSLPSVVTSATSFFAATFAVSIYSSINLISSLCTFMARGAIISMLCVLFILPAFFMLFDGVIIRTSRGFIDRGDSGKKWFGGGDATRKQRDFGEADADEDAKGHADTVKAVFGRLKAGKNTTEVSTEVAR